MFFFIHTIHTWPDHIIKCSPLFCLFLFLYLHLPHCGKAIFVLVNEMLYWFFFFSLSLFSLYLCSLCVIFFLYSSSLSFHLYSFFNSLVSFPLSKHFYSMFIWVSPFYHSFLTLCCHSFPPVCLTSVFFFFSVCNPFFCYLFHFLPLFTFCSPASSYA